MYCQNRPRILLDLLCRAIKTANAAVSEELLDDWVLGYVVGCLVNEPSVVLEAFEMSSGNISIQALSNFKRLADKMIETGGEAGTKPVPTPARALLISYRLCETVIRTSSRDTDRNC